MSITLEPGTHEEERWREEGREGGGEMGMERRGALEVRGKGGGELGTIGCVTLFDLMASQ